MEENIINPDQTAPKAAVRSVSILVAKLATKVHTSIAVNGGKMFNTLLTLIPIVIDVLK